MPILHVQRGLHDLESNIFETTSQGLTTNSESNSTTI
jgi:hypothetical protein